MPWVETDSLSFTARHDSNDAAFADRTLDRLETLRLRLENRFERVPDEGTVVIPTNPAPPNAAHPFPPPARPPSVPPRRPLGGGAGRAPLPRRLADGNRAPRPQRPPHGTARRRR